MHDLNHLAIMKLLGPRAVAAASHQGGHCVGYVKILHNMKKSYGGIVDTSNHDDNLIVR
jgi:hypothetical protein